MRRSDFSRFLLMLLIGVAPAFLAAKPDEPKLSVEGVGKLRSRELRQALERLLRAEDQKFFDANAIEDAAVILSSALGDQGFQKAQIEIEATLTDGAKKHL